MFKNNIVTSALVSAIMILLWIVVLPAFINTENERVDVEKHLPVQSLLTSVNKDDGNLVALQIRIEKLLEKQRILVDQNQHMEARVAQLESIQFQEADTAAYTVNYQAAEKPVLLIDQEERDLVSESETALGDFENLADQFFYEDYDSIWASEMESSLDEVAQRLQSFDMGSTAITNTECRSQTCVVELTHQKDVDQALIASLLPAKGAKGFTLKHTQEGDVSKTVAIYLR